MRIPGILMLPALLAVLTLTNCSSDSSSGPSDGEYTSKPDVVSKLGSCISYLEDEKWDEAVKCYDDAYAADNNDPNAIIYSSLANLAKISIDPKIATLMKDHFGFTTYPNKLNALLSDSWLKEYPEYIIDYYYDSNIGDVEWMEANSWYGEFYGISQDGYYTRECDYETWECEYTLVSTTPKYSNTSLPNIKTPDWVKGGEGTVYNDALLSGSAFGADAWAISLVANLIDKNTSGLNTLMDDVINGIFGESYNKAVERIQKLESRKNTRISLDPYFIEQFGLEDIFDEYDKVGWAEVNVVTSAMLLMKASLEWVQSYNLDNDLSPVKYSWKADSDDILNRFEAVDKTKLPFNNGFLNARPGKMANSKASFIKAIEGLQASYTAIQNSELYPAEIKDSYKTINGGFSEMIKAIKNNGKFYIPKDDPSKINSWPTKNGNDVQGFMDFKNFFTEGYLSLQKIFEVDGTKPVFYINNSQKVTLSNYESLINAGGSLKLKIKISYVKELFGSDEVEDFDFLSIGVSGDAAKVLFEKYYK